MLGIWNSSYFILFTKQTMGNKGLIARQKAWELISRKIAVTKDWIFPRSLALEMFDWLREEPFVINEWQLWHVESKYFDKREAFWRRMLKRWIWRGNLIVGERSSARDKTVIISRECLIKKLELRSAIKIINNQNVFTP